jgi:hypothetical protein
MTVLDSMDCIPKRGAFHRLQNYFEAFFLA